jgi:acyl-coenzyme A thioesterase PaaI-like protein
MKTTYVKGAKGNYLLADAHLIKKGRRINHIDCFIYDENNEIVAKASGFYMYI